MRRLLSQLWPQSPGTRDAVVGLFAIFYLVFLVNTGSLGFVWDDWEMVHRAHAQAATFQGMLKHMAFLEPRVQFLYWLWYWLMAKAFNLWAAPYFAVILAAHFGGSLLLYRSLRGLDFGEATSRAAAALYLVAPSSAPGLFAVCNSLFIFPCAALALIVWLALFPRSSRPLDLAALTFACLLCQFLNDATVPLLYLTLAALMLREMLSAPGSARFRPPMRLLIPAAVSLASLALYWLVIVRRILPGSKLPPLQWDLAKLWHAVSGLLIGQGQTLNAGSWMFGKLTVSPSAPSWILFPALAAVLWFLVVRAPADPEDRRPPAAATAAFLAVAFAGTLAPLVWALTIGYRTEVETRYLCVPGLVVAVFIAIAVDALSRLGRAPAERLRRGLLFGACLYVSSLMLYDVRDIWGLQERADEKVWARLDMNFPPQKKYLWEHPSNPRAKYIITDGLQRATLMPYNRSNAIGNFSGNVAVQGRMRLINGVELIPVSRPLGELNGRVIVKPYYEQPVLADKSEIFAVVFRSGLEYSEIGDGIVLTFPDYEDYKRYRAAEGLNLGD